MSPISVRPAAAHDARRTSVVLREFMDSLSADRISLADLIAALQDRAYGVLMLVFALPNLAPIGVPGMSVIFGAPLILLAFQLAWGRPMPWFPRWLAERSFSRAALERALLWSLPMLERTERWLRPRLLLLTGWTGERFLAAACVVFAILLSLPIPFGNWLPALALCILSLALVEKDGIAYLAGMAVGLASLAVASAVIVVLVEGALAFLSRMLA